MFGSHGPLRVPSASVVPWMGPRALLTAGLGVCAAVLSPLPRAPGCDPSASFHF